MADQDRYGNAINSEDDCVEVQLVDLTIEEQAEGPVDIDQPAEHDPSPAFNVARKKTSIEQPDKEVRSCRLTDGTNIQAGDFVELQCPQHRRTDPEHSGDYLRIAKIVKNAQTRAIVIRGHRFLREKYIVGKSYQGTNPLRNEQHPRFNNRQGARLNELMMHLIIREGDNRPATVQGLEDVPIAMVKKKRTIIVTDKPYPMLGFRNAPQGFYVPVLGKPEAEQRLHIFRNGPLICRWSRISIVSPNGKIYGSEYRYLSSRDVNSPQQTRPHPDRMNSSTSRFVPTTTHRRKSSVEEIVDPTMQKAKGPRKKTLYTLFDMYCGGGGASRGADQAGLKVIAGLDFNEVAMSAWEENDPRGIPLCMSSFDFLRNDVWKLVGKVDVMVISFPCQPYSGLHTRSGKDDEMNIAQLYVIKPLIECLKPRVVVLENTSGLANIAGNRRYFDKVLNDVTSAGSGFNIRYRVVNMADYGLPQQRKRLLIIAARRDIPLPPFPKPTHGPRGSGLKPYVSIGDALQVLEQLGDRAARDPYHKLQKQVPREQRLYDPYKKFVDCIVTKGVESLHWNGEKFTPRQLALLQSLPFHHHLTGSWAQAIKQIGNGFPPLVAELVLRTCAQTLEAFDCGFIDADEEIDDLNITLIEKGVDIPETSHTPTSHFDLTTSSRATASPYQYLSRPVFSDASYVGHSSAWAKRTFETPDTGSGSKKKRRFNSGSFADSDENGTPSPSIQREKGTLATSTEEAFWENHNGKTIVLSDSDDDLV